MFQSYFPAAGSRHSRFSRRTMTTLFSLVCHAALVLAVIVVPLVHADSALPTIQLVNLNLTKIPPAPLAPYGSEKKGVKQKTGPSGPSEQKPQPVNDRVFRTPIKVPDEIPVEDISQLSLGEKNGDSKDEVLGGVLEGEEIGKVLAPEVEGWEKSEVIRLYQIHKPKLVHRVVPDYPEVLRAARVQGRVVLDAVTDIYGRVREVRVVSSTNPLFNDPAVSAVKQWRYDPYLINGLPRPVAFTVVLDFVLSNS